MTGDGVFRSHALNAKTHPHPADGGLGQGSRARHGQARCQGRARAQAHAQTVLQESSHVGQDQQLLLLCLSSVLPKHRTRAQRARLFVTSESQEATELMTNPNHPDATFECHLPLRLRPGPSLTHFILSLDFCSGNSTSHALLPRHQRSGLEGLTPCQRNSSKSPLSHLVSQTLWQRPSRMCRMCWT